MGIMNRAMAYCHISLLNFICTSTVFADDPATPQQVSWPWWHGTHEHSHSFWWIFPLMFFVMMIVVFIVMMRRGCPGCMWRGWMMDSKEFRDAMKRNRDEHHESALEILDKRYAKGEIEKQEYEEKRAAITRSS